MSKAEAVDVLFRSSIDEKTALIFERQGMAVVVMSDPQQVKELKEHLQIATKEKENEHGTQP